MIALVDYGAGNLTSVRKALAAVGAGFFTPLTPSEIGGARGIVVPGVGHFDATRALDSMWRASILDAVQRGVSLLGICLGMQWLFDGSDEAPELPGLGLFAGTCVHLGSSSARAAKSDPAPFKVPHVGWNSVELPRDSGVMRGIGQGAQVYFTHSYVAPVGPEAAAVTRYGMAFASAVEGGRVAGVQFHPEKSGEVGLRILANWVATCA